MSVKSIPDGYRTITPYLAVKDVDNLIGFLRKAFNAAIRYRTKDKQGKAMHAELQIGNSVIMMGRTRNDEEIMPAMLYLYTLNTDKLYRKALEHGATSIMQPSDQFYGDRNAGIKDPEGNIWWIATHMEDVPPDELERRLEEQKS